MSIDEDLALANRSLIFYEDRKVKQVGRLTVDIESGLGKTEAYLIWSLLNRNLRIVS